MTAEAVWPSRVGSAIVVAAALLWARPASAAPIDDQIQLLRSRPTGMEEDEWRTKRREAARELGEVRSEKAVDALIDVVKTERYDSVLSIAIEGLGKQGDPRAIPALQQVYADRSIDTFVREQAAKAITALGGTPRDDARLVGGVATPGTSSEGGELKGPQIGTMGAASVSETADDADLESDKPLPDNLRARSRSFAFVLGDLSLAVNTLVTQQPVLADAGLGAISDYVDEREKWGWTVNGTLDTRFKNGDNTSLPGMNGNDTGNTLYFREGLQGSSDIHVYFGPTDFHAFAEVGVSQRVTHVGLKDFNGGNQSSLTSTRFAMDVIPSAGIGWGRYLGGGGDLMVDAIEYALQQENILAREIDTETRRKIQAAVYRRSNAFSTYPRLAAVLQILQEGGYLARSPGPRVVHRLRSVLEDPSYLDRPRGIRVRAGFLYGAPIDQKDFFRRNGDGLGAPFFEFRGGFQIDRERQIVADTLFWYDVVGDRSFTLSAGATYTRFLHTKYDDYRGQWYAGVRGGGSQRTYSDLAANNINPRPGYRGIALAGYAYGFRRGSQVSVTGNAGIDSGGFIVGLGLGLKFGISRGTVYQPAGSAGGGSRAGGKAKGKAKAGGSVGAGGTTSAGSPGG